MNSKRAGERVAPGLVPQDTADWEAIVRDEIEYLTMVIANLEGYLVQGYDAKLQGYMQGVDCARQRLMDIVGRLDD